MVGDVVFMRMLLEVFQRSMTVVLKGFLGVFYVDVIFQNVLFMFILVLKCRKREGSYFFFEVVYILDLNIGDNICVIGKGNLIG